MKKTIKLCNNYKLDNPFLNKLPMKYCFMIYSFTIYKKVRTYIAQRFPNFFPLNDWQKFMWTDNNIFDDKNNNAAEHGYNKRKKVIENAYFNMTIFHILDCIPKEEFKTLKNGIKKFGHKHGSCINNFKLDVSSFFDVFYDGYAYAVLSSMAIKRDSCLYPYITQIEFKINNITDSFCCLDIMVILNNKIITDLSQFIISNVKSKRDITGYENKKWYNFTNLNKRERPGVNIKAELLEEILVDLTWKITQEVHRYVPCMVLANHKIPLPHISSFCTNIDANAFPDFWRSLHITPTFCDFTLDYYGCLTWSRINDSPFYIYNKQNLNATILATDIDKYICQYLIAFNINNDFRKNLVSISHKMSSLKNKNIKHWMKLKVFTDTKLFYYTRFINEFCTDNCESDNFLKLNNNIPDNAYINSYYMEINRNIKGAQQLFLNIMNLFQTNLDYRNVKENYQIQQIVLLATIFSIIISVLSLVAATNTNIINTFCNLF